MDYDTKTAIREIRAGNDLALAWLFDAQWAHAWRVAYSVTRSRTLADDAAQTALIRALSRIDAYDEDRPFEPWLHRIVVRAALDVMRHERRHWREFEASPVPENEPDTRLWELLGQLPIEQRTAIVLRYFFDYRAEEIAELLNLPTGTVHSRIHRALAKLKTEMEATNVRPS
jgi:RNA polymerase sigma-70 factor (ECF subfamily)